jgi:tetratricopeptide (TPR) repeat protein
LGEQAALRARALDDSSGDAHAALSAARRDSYDFVSTEAELTRAVSLDPSSAHFHEWLVQLYIWTDRPVQALAEARRAIELDPLSATANAELANALCANGRYDESLALLAPLRLLRPRLRRAPAYAARCYADQGMWAQAIAEMRQSGSDAEPRDRALRAFMLARGGRPAEARLVLDSLLEGSRHGGELAGEIATVYAGLGDHDRAFAWLEQARSERTLVLDDLPLVLKELRPDRRVDLFRRRLGL